MNLPPVECDGFAATVPRGLHAATATWPQIEARLAAGALAVLPVGAAAKAHGRHLPLATDYLQAEWLAAQLVQRCEAVVWPTLSYGHYPAFVDYPGSTTLERVTFRTAAVEILRGLARAGAGRIAILNTGISTIGPLAEAAAHPGLEVPVKLVNVYDGPRLAHAQAEIEEQAWGGHADEVETSLMLVIAPQLVDMQAARPAPSRLGEGGFNRGDPAAPNYSPDGVTGDPTRATRAKGERLAQALLEDVLEALA
jgi:creatinine amidohydrolase